MVYCVRERESRAVVVRRGVRLVIIVFGVDIIADDGDEDIL